jgi:hypothetical protein
MPGQKTTSLVMKKLGERGAKAARDHANDDVKIGNFELPAGIENGVARLVEFVFQEIEKDGPNKGKLMFRATGIVVLPKLHDGVSIEGQRTNISEMLFDTPSNNKDARQTIEDHIIWVQNEMKKLGLAGESVLVENWETSAAALKELAPYFRFRTWKGKPTTEFPNPRVNHMWGGVLSDYAPADSSTNDVVDHTPVKTYSAPNDNADGALDTPTDTKGDAAAAEDLSQVALEDVTKAASQGDTEAGQEMTRRALEAGISQEDADATKSWEELAQLIEAAGSSADSEPAQEYAWAKDDVAMYSPLDPKTKKKVAKAIECEVMSSDPKSKTVQLRNLDNKKLTYKAVPWADLEVPS